jgi:hypothetical protein
MLPAHETRSKEACHALIPSNITTATMKKAWSFPVVPGEKIVPHESGKVEVSEGGFRERAESSATGVTSGDPSRATLEHSRLRTGERMLQ